MFWTVDLGKKIFIGKEALIQAKEIGIERQIIGLTIDKNLSKETYLNIDLAFKDWEVPRPHVISILSNDKQIGYATSGCWSPILECYIAIACIKQSYIQIGNYVEMEISVENELIRVPAKLVNMPFFNPARKTSSP